MHLNITSNLTYSQIRPVLRTTKRGARTAISPHTYVKFEEILLISFLYVTQSDSDLCTKFNAYKYINNQVINYFSEIAGFTMSAILISP